MESFKIIDFGFGYRLMNLSRNQDIEMAKKLFEDGSIDGISIFQNENNELCEFNELKVLLKAKAIVINLDEDTDL